MRICRIWLKVGATRMIKVSSYMFISQRMMRGTKVCALQRTCLGSHQILLVRKTNFDIFQQHTTHQPLLSLFPSPLLCFQVLHKYTHQSLVLYFNLFTQFYLFHLHSTLPQHSMHIVHWFSTSCWMQYIWISLAIYCKCFNINLLNSVGMNWVVSFVEIWSMFCALSRRK
jgi:hypothetical protein